MSPATGHPSIIGIEFSAQLPGEFGDYLDYSDFPGTTPFSDAPQISDYPAA
jgi:hypothetical protein